MSNKSYKHKKDLLFEALENQKGNITDACKAADVSRVTFYRWIKEHKELEEHVASVQELTLDYVENKLFLLIEDKNVAAILFYLKTRGKARGYVEKQEISIDTTDLSYDIKIESRTKTDTE